LNLLLRIAKPAVTLPSTVSVLHEGLARAAKAPKVVGAATLATTLKPEARQGALAPRQGLKKLRLGEVRNGDLLESGRWWVTTQYVYQK